MPLTDPADDEPTDASLVERIRRGSPEALDPLYRRHGAGVYRFVRREQAMQHLLRERYWRVQ